MSAKISFSILILERCYSKDNFLCKTKSFIKVGLPPTEPTPTSITIVEFIKKIIELLDLNIKILKSSELNVFGDQNTRLFNICKSLNCSTYISGPAAKSYLNEKLFTNNDIQVEYYNYNNFKEYKQNWNGFDHKVSILDMFFNLGSETINYFNET